MPATILSVAGREAILRSARREIDLLVARDDLTITHARYEAGERVAGPHVHEEHTDAFYVLEGALEFEIGREAETIAVSAGGFVAAPPGVAHAFRATGDRPARWLTVHAPDGGFAAFMRGGGEWDIAPVPAGGGGSSAAAVVSLGGDPGEPAHERRPSRLRCALPDLRVVEWRLRAPRSGLPSPRPERGVDAFFVIDGELEATVGETRRTAGEGSLITVPRGVAYALAPSGPRGARLLGLHTPVSPRL